MSEICCTRLAGNTGRKDRHLRTIAQFRKAISKARIDNRKKPVKQQYLLHMSAQYGELQPTTG